MIVALKTKIGDNRILFYRHVFEFHGNSDQDVQKRFCNICESSGVTLQDVNMELFTQDFSLEWEYKLPFDWVGSTLPI